MARHGLGRALVQPREALVQPGSNRFDRQAADLSGGDLDRQRDAVKLPADAGDCQYICICQLEMQQRLRRAAE